MNQETSSPVLATTIATLKAAVVDLGPDVVLAALAEGGVFLPQHLLYKQIRETEGLLEGEQFAHGNTGEELDRTQQLLAAEHALCVKLQHENASLRAAGGEACFDVPRTPTSRAGGSEQDEEADAAVA